MSTASASAGTITTDSASGGTADWGALTLTNAIGAANTTVATCTVPGGEESYYLVAGTFAFVIPGTATVDGITVVIRKKSSSTNSSDAKVRIVKGGVIGSTDKAAGGTWATTLTDYTYGGSGDLWGETWLPLNVNAVGFGVAISGTNPNNRTLSIDSFTVTINYTDEVAEGEEAVMSQSRIWMQQP